MSATDASGAESGMESDDSTRAETDRRSVAALIGREPAGDFVVVVRDTEGQPVVVRNAPLLHDGTPMPTLYWLVGRREVTAVSRLEAEGAIDVVEDEIGLDVIADIHDRYRAERDADRPPGVSPWPSHGVGGTRRGVKCLHAHLAHWLAGGDDRVGEWTAERIVAAGLDLPERAR